MSAHECLLVSGFALRFYLYLLVGGVVVVVIAVWLSPSGPACQWRVAVTAAYLTTIIGRLVLGRKSV
jgi:uncharacterized membrane protein YqjE